MSDAVKVERTVEFTIDVKDIAAAFAEMDDDAQAQFFVHAARLLLESCGGRAQRESQLCAIGEHLRTCSCSTEDARQMLRDLLAFMDDKTPLAGPPA